MSQLELDVTRRKHKGSETSVKAFQGTAPQLRALQRDTVLSYIKVKGGLTCEEVSYGLSIRYTAASARMSELQRDGLIEDSGERRPTSTGRSARVMRAR